jgi:signal transduction histidine kinase
MTATAASGSSEALERLTDLGHLSSGVGHHVINAFSAIVSSAELLRLSARSGPAADPVAIAETIIKTALEASTVARRLIDYTRPLTSIEAGPAAFVPEAVQLDKVAAEVVAAEAGSRPAITWESELQPVAAIRGHEAQLRLMLAHLLENAREALPSNGGTIRVSTSTDSRGWNVLEIFDSGQGMQPGTLERAVEPFFSTKPGHLGIGLSIAHGIWRRHRGTLSIQTRRGEGTSIRLFVEPRQS